MRRRIWLMGGLWSLATLFQKPTPTPKPVIPLDTLVTIEADAQSSERVYFGLLEGHPPEVEAMAASEAFRFRALSLMDRALTLARSHPSPYEAVAAPTWVVQKVRHLGGAEVEERGNAAFRLLAEAPILDDEAIVPAILNAEITGSRCPEIEPFLRSVLTRSRNRRIVALARYNLGRYKSEMSRMPDRLVSPIGGREIARSLPKDRIERFRSIDRLKLRREAEALLEQVLHEESDIRIQLNGPPLGDLASGDLYRIRNLNLGQVAPDLIGEDIDGVPLRLSDFRGKVVVLSFWATWCGPCMDLVDEEKALVSAMKGRPFILVGVNCDETADRDKVKVAIKENGITWRSFWAGGPNGVIPQQWGIHGWPTIYTIDAKGIIRDDLVSDKLSPDAFEKLIREAQEDDR